MVTIPTIEEIRTQIFGDIESADTSSPLLPKSVLNIIATAFSFALYLCYKLGLWLYDQIFTKTMDDDALANRGAEYGLTKTAATKWKGTVTILGDDGIIINAGDIATFEDYSYQVDEAVTISGGTATANMTSLDTGDSVNLDDGDELSWSTPKASVTSTVVASTTQTGEDAESNTSFRSRILKRQRLQIQAGTAAWWVSLALEISGISEAFAYNTSPGVVSIYPLTDDTDPTNRIPSPAKLTESEEYLSDSSRRLFLATVNVIAFTELTFNITITGISPDSTTLRSSIESAIEDYLYARRPKQYDDEVNPVDTVSSAEITALLIDAGAVTGTVELEYGGNVITSKELEYYQLAKPGTIAWA